MVIALLAIRSKRLADLALRLGQFGRLFLQLTGLFGKPIGSSLAEFVAQFIQFPLRTRPGGQRLREPPLFQGLGSTADVFPCLLELLPRFGIVRRILLLVHPAVQLIGVPQHFLLFVAQSFQLLQQFFLLFFGGCLFQFRLQLLQTLVQVILSAGQFAQPIEDLAIFVLGTLLPFFGLALGLVSVLVIGQRQLLQLLLRSTGTTATGPA